VIDYLTAFGLSFTGYRVAVQSPKRKKRSLPGTKSWQIALLRNPLFVRITPCLNDYCAKKFIVKKQHFDT
jgi:hypothetical protein